MVQTFASAAKVLSHNCSVSTYESVVSLKRQTFFDRKSRLLALLPAFFAFSLSALCKTKKETAACLESLKYVTDLHLVKENAIFSSTASFLARHSCHCDSDTFVQFNPCSCNFALVRTEAQVQLLGDYAHSNSGRK